MAASEGNNQTNAHVANCSFYDLQVCCSANSPPPKVTLSYPEDGDDTFINRTPRFNWTAVNDADGDPVTYNIVVSLNSDCSSPFENVTGLSANYYDYPTELTLDTTYYWRVRANDSSEYGQWSDIWNFTLIAYYSINLTVSNVNFGYVAPGNTYSTDGGSPSPFIIENIGNDEANITINATSLWESSKASLDTDYYQFKANRTESLDSFDWDMSQTAWANMSSTEKGILAYFNHTNGNNKAAIDVRIVVPNNEPPTSKYSNVTVYVGSAY